MYDQEEVDEEKAKEFAKVLFIFLLRKLEQFINQQVRKMQVE